MPTCFVIGCRDTAVAQRLQRAFTAPFFRAYTSADIAGVELGGIIDAQRTANDAELALARNRQARLAYSVDLMKALGGGWTAAPKP